MNPTWDQLYLYFLGATLALAAALATNLDLVAPKLKAPDATPAERQRRSAELLQSFPVTPLMYLAMACLEAPLPKDECFIIPLVAISA